MFKHGDGMELPGLRGKGGLISSPRVLLPLAWRERQVDRESESSIDRQTDVWRHMHAGRHRYKVVYCHKQALAVLVVFVSVSLAVSVPVFVAMSLIF